MLERWQSRRCTCKEMNLQRMFKASLTGQGMDDILQGRSNLSTLL